MYMQVWVLAFVMMYMRYIYLPTILYIKTSLCNAKVIQTLADCVQTICWF